MSAADHAYYDHEMQEFGHWTENGEWRRIDAGAHDSSASV